MTRENIEPKLRLSDPENARRARESQQRLELERGLPTVDEANTALYRRLFVLNSIVGWCENDAAYVGSFIESTRQSFTPDGRPDMMRLWDWSLPGAGDDSVRAGTVRAVTQFMQRFVSPYQIVVSGEGGASREFAYVLINRQLNESNGLVPMSCRQFLRVVFWGEMPTDSYPVDRDQQVTWNQVAGLFARLQVDLQHPLNDHFTLDELLGCFK